MAFLQPEKGIRYQLVNAAAVQAICGASPVVAPVTAIPRNAVMPFITYNRTSGSPMHYMGGVAASGLWMGSTEVTAYAETYDGAVALANAARGVLDGNDSATATISGDSVTFERLRLESETIESFDPADASDSRVHTVTQLYEWSARP